MPQQPPFDPQEFARWLVDGLKETIAYRLRQTLNREKLLEFVQSKVPTKNQVLHQLLRKSFERGGFQFEPLHQGDATFQLIRKRFRDPAAGKPMRRCLLIPGFGDSPASWIPSYTFAAFEIRKQFDELIVIDFPGYLGFLSESTLVPSMAVLQSVVRTVCEVYSPQMIIGHSLGGWLAAKVAQVSSRPLEALILVAPSGLTPDLAERKAFGDFFINSRSLGIEQLISKVMHDPKPYHQWLSSDIQEFFSKPEVREFVESVKPEEFVDPSVPFHAKRVALIWGENDRFVPAHWMRHWVESYGTFLDAYVMKKTGHMPQIERPKVFAEVLMQALRPEVGSSGDGRNWKKVHHRVKDFPVGTQITSRGGVKLLASTSR